jgi:hypothetical protein
VSFVVEWLEILMTTQRRLPNWSNPCHWEVPGDTDLTNGNCGSQLKYDSLAGKYNQLLHFMSYMFVKYCTISTMKARSL